MGSRRRFKFIGVGSFLLSLGLYLVKSSLCLAVPSNNSTVNSQVEAHGKNWVKIARIMGRYEGMIYCGIRRVLLNSHSLYQQMI